MSDFDCDSDYELAELVDIAVNSFDAEAEGAKVSGSENITQLEWSLPAIIEESDVKPHNFHLSEDAIENELRLYLANIKRNADPGRHFENNLEEFKQRLREKPTKQYTIAFPLNLSFKPGRKQNQFTALGQDIERVSRREWLDQFKDPAEKQEQQVDRTNREDPFTSFMNEVPNEFNSNHTYWKFNIDARDQQYAVNRLEITLEYLLGKINCAELLNQQKGYRSTQSAWPVGWSKLKLPFIYLVFDQEGYQQFFYSTDISPRQKYSIHSARRSKFDHYMEEFPEFQYPLSRPEEVFVQTIRRFQSAITEPKREDSFLEFWRGIEALTLVGPEDSMQLVIDRASSFVVPSQPSQYLYRLQRARNKRNNLVHEGVDISVTKQDLNLVKSAHDNLIQLYVDNINDWSLSDFEYFLDTADMDIGHLQERQAELGQRQEIIRNLIEEKQYEPSGLEKLVADWLGQKNELADADFLDPLGSIIPVFGVGDRDAEILVVSQAPAYPRNEGEDPIRERVRVRGPRPDSTYWTVDSLRQYCTELVQRGNPDGIWDVLTAIGEATDTPPEDLYYTTLQKDGKFDESIEETEDGYDPVELNRESVGAWKPYLREEIEDVQPQLIIVFGERTLEAIVDLLSIIPDESPGDIDAESSYVLDRYTVLWFDHWNDIALPDGESLSEYLENIIGEEW